MSLVVWLPMTKDLRQQGLSDVTVVNNGATFNSSGKLGGCYQFGTAASGIEIPKTSMTSFSEASVSFWVKILSWNTSYCTLFQAGTSSRNWVDYIFGILRNGTNSTLCFTIGNTSSTTTNACQTSTLNLNEWYHMTFTYKSDKMKIYLNGNLDKEYTTSYVPTFNKITKISLGRANDSQYQSNCLMNDVRIYDHCLSPMEVKRISQGLILHYPLNNMGFGQENLAHNTYGLKPFSTNQVEFKAYDVGLLDVSNGEQITISFDLDMTVATGGSGYLQIYNTNYPGPHQIATGNALAGRTLVAGQDIHERIGYTTTMTTRSSSSYSTDRIEFYSNYSTENEIQISNIKIERGSKATPWCPNSSDDLATQMGLNSNIEYDTSGYCNNGTRTGTFNWTSNTPKYEVSTKFNGAGVIVVPFTCGSISEAVTIACWGYESNWNVSTAERLLGAATMSSGWCIGDYGSENTLFAFYANGSYNTATGFKQLSSGWHHFVITFDGLNLIYYVDGQQFSKKTFSTKQVATGNCNINIGRHYGGGYNFKGDMSDVRIYATALSADDVKSLYQNCATIDSNGTIHGQIRT